MSDLNKLASFFLQDEAKRKSQIRSLTVPEGHGPISGVTVGDAADAAAGAVPGLGDALAAEDLATAIRKRDKTGIAAGALSMALPVAVTGASLATLLRAGRSPAATRVPLSQAGMVGARFGGPRVKLSGSRELGGEISDAKMRVGKDILHALAALPKGQRRRISMREVLHHPEYFDKYPEAHKMNVEVLPYEYPGDGYFDPTSATIAIHPNRIDDAENVFRHELQHKVQEVDGRLYPPKEDVRKYAIQGQEREARLTEQRGEFTQGELEGIPRADDQRIQTEILRKMLRRLHKGLIIRIKGVDGGVMEMSAGGPIPRGSRLENDVVGPNFYPDLLKARSK